MQRFTISIKDNPLIYHSQNKVGTYNTSLTLNNHILLMQRKHASGIIIVPPN